MKLVGYAATFNSHSVDLGDFIEVIAPGAFARTIRDGHPIFAVHHHNFAQLLGSTQGGSLSLSEDGRGLHFQLDLPDTSLARDVHELVKRGILAHMSFSFTPNGAAGERWKELSNGMFERTLLDVDLFEISTVALPAYKSSSVSARDFAQAMQETHIARNRMLKRFMTARLEAA